MDILTPELRALLRAVGLSEREVRTYLMLVEEGPMTARDVSDRLGVPYTKAYTYLRKLESLGAVERIGSRPAMYAARPPKQVVAKLAEAASRLIRSLEDAAAVLQAAYEARYGSLGTGTFVSIIRGPEVVRRASTIVLRSEKVDVAMAHPQLAELAHAISEASTRARVRVLIKRGIRLELPPRVEARVRDEMFGSGVIGDEAMLIVELGGVLTALHTGDRFIIDMARTYFDYLYNTSEPSQTQM